MRLSAEQLEKPLPKPQRDPAGYAAARALEALLEALIALEFLEKGYTRNAAGKAFQAWRALIGALVTLERKKIVQGLGEEEKRWLSGRAIPRIPTTRLRRLARLLEEATGRRGLVAYTAMALELHDYQYHGSDPDLELSKYRDRGEAAYDIKALLEELLGITKQYLKPLLEERGKWTRSHEDALKKLDERLEEQGISTQSS